MKKPEGAGGITPVIAAVVVTYHRPIELRMVVESLLGQTHPLDHIIILDNGGPVRSAEILTDYADSLIIIHSETNLGGAGGFAMGLSKALTQPVDWVWMMDDDAVPESEALEQLLCAIPDLPPKAGALGCAVKEFGEWAVRHRRRFNSLTGWESNLSISDYNRNFVEIDTCSFVGFLVRAEAARQIDLPVANFFLAYDDTDYSLRLKDAGWRLWLVPASVVVHLRTSTAKLSTSPFGDKHYLNIRNRLIVKRRNAECRTVATVDGLAYGLMLWLRSGGWNSLSQCQLLLHAFRDGLAARLGPAPSQNDSCIKARLLPSSDTKHFRGVVIIRTQGRRPKLLLQAIQSVRDQSIPLSMIIVVHSERQAFISVTEAVAGKAAADIKVLHAPELSRNRGYPLNVGLAHAYKSGSHHEFVAFLDDDDVLYPQFGSAMATAFADQAVDMVYAASNKRGVGAEAEPAYQILPVACLLCENFIPINAYAVRLDSLRTKNVRFDEALEVLEDWNFLHRLMAHGFRFAAVSEYLSEFLLTGDGNTPDKQDQAMWNRAWEGVHRFLEDFWTHADAARLVASFYDFDFRNRPSLSQDERRRLRETEKLLLEHFPAEVKTRASNPGFAAGEA